MSKRRCFLNFEEYYRLKEEGYTDRRIAKIMGIGHSTLCRIKKEKMEEAKCN